MIDFRSIPLLRITVSFMLGIIGGKFVELSDLAVLSLAALSFSLAIISSYNKHPGQKWVVGAALNWLLLSIGVLSIHFSNSYQNNNHFTRYIDSAVYYAELSIKDISTIDSSKVKCIAEVNTVKIGTKTIETFGKCLVTFSRNDTVYPGDKFICKARFAVNDHHVLNPGSFNYWEYLANKDVYAQAYCYDKNRYLVKHDNSFRLKNEALKIRQRLIDLLSIYLSGDELSVALALIIGYDDLISKDVYNAFANTGTLHVLSVSGMHVGLVYGLVLWVLSFIKDINRKRLLELVIALPLLWFYAFITGLSPSVMRAALMLSFIVVGNSLKQKPSVYNSLCGSALLMLVINPQLLFNVSFQLSYLAVIGISFFYKRIYDLWYLESEWSDKAGWFTLASFAAQIKRLPNKAWQLTAASLAAQITTLPISLYYFNQFPNYFLLNNLLVIPLSTIIIYLGIALICFSPISLIAVYLSKLTSILLAVQNKAVDYLSKLPYAGSVDLYLTSAEVFLLYTLLLLLMVFLTTRKLALLKSIMSCILAFVLFHFVVKIHYSNRSNMIVYQGKNAAIGFVNEGSLLFIGGKENRQLVQSTKKQFHLANETIADINTSLSEVVNNVLIYSNHYQFKGKHIVYLNNKESLMRNKLVLNNCDIVVIDGKVFPSNELVLKPKSTLIISQNTGYQTTEKWREIAHAKQLNIHIIKEKGAFVTEL